MYLAGKNLVQARGESSPSRVTSSAQATLLLQTLIQRLDNIIPYLSLSISAVGLAELGGMTLETDVLLQLHCPAAMRFCWRTSVTISTRLVEMCLSQVSLTTHTEGLL